MASESKSQCEVDRISELPDAVLCHILSLLPTMHTVWTTVLSRRWNNLWTSLPKLSFDNKDFPRSDTVSEKQNLDHFLIAVEGALGFHRLSDIQKFCLSVSTEHFSSQDHSRIHSSICSAIRHNVAEINLSLSAEIFMEDPFELPQCLFMCPTLENLTVISNFRICAPPTASCFPHLKVLHVSVLWTDDNAPDDFFRNFPVLEDLTIAGELYFHDEWDINISAPALKSLRISLRCGNNYYDSVNSFVFSVPKLEYLELMEDALSNYIFKSAQSLVKAKVFTGEVQFQDAVEFFHRDPGFTIRATGLLAQISNVEYLSFHTHCLEASAVPAVWNNLTKLKLVLCDCYNWKLLIKFLTVCPKLKYLVIDHMDTDADRVYALHSECQWSPPDFVPICLLSQLKSIKIKGFKGNHNEIEAARYLLEYSYVLKEMNIYPGDLQYTAKEELHNEICHFQRGSKACIVSLG